MHSKYSSFHRANKEREQDSLWAGTPSTGHDVVSNQGLGAWAHFYLSCCRTWWPPWVRLRRVLSWTTWGNTHHLWIWLFLSACKGFLLFPNAERPRGEKIGLLLLANGCGKLVHCIVCYFHRQNTACKSLDYFVAIFLVMWQILHNIMWQSHKIWTVYSLKVRI